MKTTLTLAAFRALSTIDFAPLSERNRMDFAECEKDAQIGTTSTDFERAALAAFVEQVEGATRPVGDITVLISGLFVELHCTDVDGVMTVIALDADKIA